MKSLRITAAAAFLLAGLAGLIGCLYIPGNYRTLDGAPRPESQIGSSNSGKPLQIMRATRQDVERVLGHPSFEGDNGRNIVYAYEINTGLWISLCYGAQPDNESRYLRLRFSPDGRLQDFKVFKDRLEAEAPLLT